MSRMFQVSGNQTTWEDAIAHAPYPYQVVFGTRIRGSQASIRVIGVRDAHPRGFASAGHPRDVLSATCTVIHKPGRLWLVLRSLFKDAYTGVA